jgi:hypothetical protein
MLKPPIPDITLNTLKLSANTKRLVKPVPVDNVVFSSNTLAIPAAEAALVDTISVALSIRDILIDPEG